MKQKLLLLFAVSFIMALCINAQDPGTTNLKHSWKFETNANDGVGTANGVLVGDATIDNGDLLVESAASYVRLKASAIDINTYTQLSVSCWFTTPTDPAANSTFAMLWYFGGSETDGVGGTTLFGSNGIFFQPSRADAVARTAISCGNLATPWTTETGINRSPMISYGDSLYHEVTTINDKYLSLYINGVLIDTANLSGSNSLANLKNDSAWICRGGYLGDNNYWARVHEVTMYDKMLSAGEVTWLYNNSGYSHTGINQTTNPSNVNIYASNRNIYIQNIDNINISSIQVYDLLGKMVYQTNKFQDVISPDLPSSVYFVKIQSNQGQFVSKVAIK